LKRTFRLTKTNDLSRVRQSGRSFVHPLIVLQVLPNESSEKRFAVSASRVVGNAVERNRTRRHLREAIRPLTSSIAPGYDVLILARGRASKASFQELQSAVEHTLRQANLMDD
jgi:ribonuclease P protein component